MGTLINNLDILLGKIRHMHITKYDETDEEIHTRWCAKQLLMDETDEEIHTRWCAKQLLMDETNEGLHIPDEVTNNCWMMRQMKESIPDGVWNNCWWMRPMKDYPYQMRYKTTVDEWNRWRNPFQMMSKTKYWPTNIRCKEKLIGQCS